MSELPRSPSQDEPAKLLQVSSRQGHLTTECFQGFVDFVSWQ